MKKLIALILILSLWSTMIVSVLGENAALQDVEDQITQISEDEKAIVDVLYKLEQEIQESENKEQQINEQINEYKNQIIALQERIDEESNRFDLNKDILGEVLKVYQKRGPGTFVEILLSSESLSDLVQKLNILKDLTKKTGILLDELDLIRAQLETTQQEKTDKLTLVETEQQQLIITISETKKRKEEQQSLLNSLLEQKVRFEEILQEMTLAWETFKSVFTKASKGFSELATNGSLPEDAITISYGLGGAKAMLGEDAFNQAIINNTNLPKMLFSFEESNIMIEIPEQHIILNGNFIIENDRILVFKIDSGEFYEVELEQSALDEMVEKGTLTLDLEPLIGKSKITSVKSELNTLNLSVKISFF